MTAATTTPGPVVRAAAEGDRRWFFSGGMHTWKVRAEETNGAFLLFEDQMILMHIDGREYPISAGGIAMAPRGLPHAFMVVSESARMLCLHTPGCCEAFYWDASEPADGEATGVVDFDRIRASAHRNGGIEILGPPPPFTRG